MSRRRLWLLPAAAMALCACGRGSVDSTVDLSQDYSAVQPFSTSDTRSKHVGLISDMNIRTEMESGLMDLAKGYFSPDEYTYKVHEFLDYEELDATDGSRGLLGTLRDNNPNGLNPSASEEFDTGNGKVTGATVLYDIYEVDFYRGDQLKGIALGIVVTDQLTDDEGNTVPITDEKMKAYLDVAVPKLVSYMRERFNAVTPNVPILVGAYELDHSSNTNNGGYVYMGWFSNGSQKFMDVDQSWLIVPGAAFSKADPDMAAEFSSYKEDLQNILADSSYVTGKAKVQDGKTIRLDITITVNGKTTGEILAVTQAARDALSVFGQTDCVYRVTVKTAEKVYAVLKRSMHSSQVEEITLL